MSSDWYLMSASTLSGFEDAEFAFDKGGFADITNSFLGKSIQIYGTKITNTPTTIKGLIQNQTSDNFFNTHMRTIQCAIGSLKCGDYLYFDSQWWIVASMPANNQVYEKAILWYCKYQLKMMIPGASTASTYPAFFQDATQYNSGETAKTQMTIGSGQLMVYLPYNADTIKIDSDFRILADRNTTQPTAYRVTKVDTISYAFGAGGMICWMLVEDTLRTADNISTMVADNTVPPTPTGSSGW